MTHAVTVTKRNVGACAQRAGRHAGCAMQRGLNKRIACCWRLVPLLVSTLFTIGPVRAATAPTPLQWPLATTHHKLTGGFGESRTNRFHAGLDLSTGGVV